MYVVYSMFFNVQTLILLEVQNNKYMFKLIDKHSKVRLLFVSKTNQRQDINNKFL